MSGEFIDNKIDMCHELIEQGEYKNVVEILKLMGEIRIHDESLKEKIEKFEKEHDETLDKRLIDIEHSNDHGLIKQDNRVKEWFSYAVAYLKFYDKLRKEYELY